MQEQTYPPCMNFRTTSTGVIGKSDPRDRYTPPEEFEKPGQPTGTVLRDSKSSTKGRSKKKRIFLAPNVRMAEWEQLVKSLHQVAKARESRQSTFSESRDESRPPAFYTGQIESLKKRLKFQQETENNRVGNLGTAKEYDDKREEQTMQKLENKSLLRSVDGLKQSNDILRGENKDLICNNQSLRDSLSQTRFGVEELVDIVVSAGGLNRVTIFDDRWHKAHGHGAHLLFGFQSWQEAKEYIAVTMPDLKDFSRSKITTSYTSAFKEDKHWHAKSVRSA
jgi:hypothetical protein